MELKDIGEKIREIRKAKKMSLQELADLSEIPLNTLGRIERGENWPSTQWMIRLSDALDVPIGMLLVQDKKETPYIHFRGEKELGDKLVKEIENIIGLYARLEDICGAEKFHSFPLDIPLYNYSLEKIIEISLLARNVLGIGNAVIFDLIHLLESAGLRVVVSSLPKQISGFSYFSRITKSVSFFLNVNDTNERKIFTLAHELGHLIFHQGGVKYYVYQPFVEDNELEKAAHGFASAFLMPEGVVKATVKQLGITANGWTYDLLLSIKSRFGVSAEAFLYRLFDLELISKKQREFIKSQIDDFYKDSKYQEPSPTSLVLHENQRLKDLLLIGKNISAYEKEVKEIEKKLISLGLVLF